MKPSQVFDALGLGAALLKAEAALGLERGAWAPVADPQQKTEMQREIRARLPAIAAALPRIANLVRTWASVSAAELNGILKSEGFDIQVDPWPASAGIGVVAIVDVLVKWLVAGEKAAVLRGDERYSAFRLECVANAIEFHAVAASQEPVVVVFTRSGDKVCLHKVDEVAGDFGLYDAVAHLRREMRRDRDANYADVVIPKVQLREQVDLGWIRGLAAVEWKIEQAKQEVRFAMNEIGAHAKMATALAPRSMSPRGPTGTYTFDAPFLFWMERPGVAIPTFVAHLTEADWRDPGSLDDL